MTVRKAAETILQIIIIFLIAIWLFSFLLHEVSVYSLLPALSATYIIVHYWERHIIYQKLKTKSIDKK